MWTAANVDAQDKDGYSVLMGAAREGHAELATILMERTWTSRMDRGIPRSL